MTEALDDLLQNMPGDDATEAEIEAFMGIVMATPGGAELIRGFAGQITEGGALDSMIKEEEAKLDEFALKSPARFIFRIEILGTKPLVWRRFSLPTDCAYFHLHCAIQDSLGWQDVHRHRFEVWEEGHCELVFSSDEEAENDCCEIENRIVDLFNENVTEFIYLYDFGDEWRHRIVIEELAQAGTKGTIPGMTPHLHDGQGHGPPEDCGGIAGFQNFLKGDHLLCENYEPEILEELRTGKPDFSKVTFRDPAIVLRKQEGA